MNSESIYRILLKAYPNRYRRRYETAMAQCFRDQLVAADTRNKRARLWVRTLFDFSRNVPARHLDLGRDTSCANAYSDVARRAIYLSQLEKGPLSYGQISLEHLLLGALRSDEDLNRALLGTNGMTPLVTRMRACDTNGVVPPQSLSGRGRRYRRKDSLDSDCQKALAYARQEARDSGATVSARHILLGVLAQETSLAARCLRDCAGDLSFLSPNLARDNRKL